MGILLNPGFDKERDKDLSKYWIRLRRYSQLLIFCRYFETEEKEGIFRMNSQAQKLYYFSTSNTVLQWQESILKQIKPLIQFSITYLDFRQLT